MTCQRTNLKGLDSPGEQYVSSIDFESAIKLYLPEFTLLSRTVEIRWQHRPMEFSGILEMALPCNHHLLGEHLKCGWCNEGTSLSASFQVQPSVINHSHPAAHCISRIPIPHNCNFVPLTNISPFPPFPVPGNHCSALCFYVFFLDSTYK